MSQQLWRDNSRTWWAGKAGYLRVIPVLIQSQMGNPPFFAVFSRNSFSRVKLDCSLYSLFPHSPKKTKSSFQVDLSWLTLYCHIASPQFPNNTTCQLECRIQVCSRWRASAQFTLKLFRQFGPVTIFGQVEYIDSLVCGVFYLLVPS